MHKGVKSKLRRIPKGKPLRSLAAVVPSAASQINFCGVQLGGRDHGGRSYLIVEGHSSEVEIITQADAWRLLGRAAHTTLPIP